jgi:aryl-alcohol dehydrogenase-like predicted oxidoreductase
MDKRKLGKTGEMLSVIGFGGILVMNETVDDSARVVARAVQEHGINYFDVAPSYGNAEERLGPALEPYRKDVFLACKTGKRSADEATAELHQSLERMRTDHFDLYQLHAVTTMDDVEQITGPDGALEAFIKAREQGLVRYLGFSAHSEEAALELMNRYDFDTILFPFNWVCWHQGGFGPKVIARAQEKEMGILALKALARCKWLENEEREWSKTWYRPVGSYDEASLALRFTLSRPVTAAVTPGHDQFLDWATRVVAEFQPLSDAEEDEVARQSAGLDPIFPH